MKTTAAVLGLIFLATVVTFGQTRTVTNATLERFAQKRIAAERDYRENYARLGFPSPEELDRQRDADMKARLELADQLRQSRLEKERLDIERQRLALDAARFDAEMDARDYDDGIFYGGGFIGGFGGFGGFDRFGRFGRFDNFFPRHRFGRFPRNPQVIRITPFGVQPFRPGTTKAFIRGGKRR